MVLPLLPIQQLFWHCQRRVFILEPRQQHSSEVASNIKLNVNILGAKHFKKNHKKLKSRQLYNYLQNKKFFWTPHLLNPCPFSKKKTPAPTIQLTDSCRFAGLVSVQMTMFFARGADSQLGHGWNVSQAIYVASAFVEKG